MGGGVRLGPLGSAATYRPIVPAQDDYDDGEIGGIMTGRGAEVLGENLPQCRVDQGSYVYPENFVRYL
jgi:hypothetical protein